MCVMVPVSKAYLMGLIHDGYVRQLKRPVTFSDQIPRHLPIFNLLSDTQSGYLRIPKYLQCPTRHNPPHIFGMPFNVKMHVAAELAFYL